MKYDHIEYDGELHCNYNFLTLFHEIRKGFQYLNLDNDYQPAHNHDLAWKRKLMQSLLNGYPIGTFRMIRNKDDDWMRKYDYDVIDGRERMKTIRDFINDKFTLGDDVKLFTPEGEVSFGDLTYRQLRKKTRIAQDGLEACPEVIPYKMTDPVGGETQEEVEATFRRQIKDLMELDGRVREER